jgi:hypothetical protein
MKTMRVKAKNGKSTPIFLLTNLDLIFCVPIFILNLVNMYIAYPLILRFINLVGWPAAKLIGDVGNASKAKTWVVTTLYMAMLPAAYLFTAFNPDAGPLASALWTGALLIVGLALGEIFCFANNIQAAPPMGPCITRDVFAEEGRAIPEYLVDHKYSRNALVTSLFLTIHIIYNLVFLTLFIGHDWLYFAPLIVLLQIMLFTDKEHVEHLSSHAAGRITRIESAKTVQDYMYVFLNFLRKYITWPLQFWSPNYYYATHTGIHHVEDNGPADFQSTLRYDQTSFVDFVKAVTWYSLFINLIPVEIVSYYVNLKRKKFLGIYLRGYLLGNALFALVAWFHPLLGATLFGLHLTSGLRSYLFVMRWHGFHDATRPYSVEASNNSPLHYGHHQEQNVHLMIVTECCRVFWKNREKEPKNFPIFVSSTALETYARNSMLVFFMLWQGKIDIISKFIYTDGNSRSELKKYVTGMRYQGKSAWLAPIDEKLSKFMGKMGEKMHRKSMSPDDIAFFDDNSPRVMMNIRVTNFRKLAIRSTDENLPQGVY